MKRATKAITLAAETLLSAQFWFVLLVISGALSLSYGVAFNFGRGYGFMAFGVLCILGSQAIRGGLTRG